MTVKWKKLAAEALRTAPGHALKASKLRRAVLEAARAKHGAALASVDDDALAAALEARLAGSSRFDTGDDGRVTLVAGGNDADD